MTIFTCRRCREETDDECQSKCWRCGSRERGRSTQQMTEALMRDLQFCIDPIDWAIAEGVIRSHIDEIEDELS